jgi:anti-anti-sigma factor
VSTPGLRVDRENGVLVVALEGEHDLASRESVRGAIDGALDGGLAVVIDLQATGFIDSVIVAVFLEARKKAKQQNLGLGIVLSDSPRNEVRRMFELSELTTVFRVHPSREAALQAVRGGFVETT